jgi:hypothetical protein
VTRFYIPELGDEIVLSKDWKFRLFSESRNSGLFDRLGIVTVRESLYGPLSKIAVEHERILSLGYKFDTELVNNYWGDGQAYCNTYYHEVILPKGTILKVDRIYIRKGQDDYSSLTFFITGSPHPMLSDKKGPKRRFWAKLADVNDIEFNGD